MLRFTVLLIALVALPGCVANIPLTSQTPAVDYVSAQSLAVSVVDDRERVKTGGKPKTFIGVAHGSFGIPFDWNVKPILAVEKGDDKRDLSQFLQYRVVQGLVTKGATVVELPMTALPSDADVAKLMADHGNGRLLLMKINEWYFSINLNWVGAFNFDTDTEVTVYETGRGKVLQKRFAGRDVIDMQAKQSPRNHILLAYRDQLAEILSDPEIKEALAGPSQRLTATP